MQNQTNIKYSSNPKGIFKSAKKYLWKLNPTEDSSKTTVKVLSKILKYKTSNKTKPQKKKTIQLLQEYDFFRSLWHVVGS